ncbi:hypothetical protein KKB99_00810, partial [bacterium]|nr:hypothetical protein [bacterium]MBU1024526.1 hypothetical protein [bacterium]
MKLIPFIHIIILMFSVISCTAIKTDSDHSINIKPGNSKSDQTQQSDKISDDKENLLKGIESKLRTLLICGEDLDDELIQKVLLEYLKVNLGYLLFVEYASNLDPGKLPSDLCLEFANAMMDGGWKEEFNQAVESSPESRQVLKAVIFLSRSLETDYPAESRSILDFYLK